MKVRCLGRCGALVPTSARKGRCAACLRKLDGSRNTVAGLRDAVLARDRYVCQVKGPPCVGVATNADHVVPLSGGGLDTMGNLQASCAPCNRWKAARRSESTIGRDVW